MLLFKAVFSAVLVLSTQSNGFVNPCCCQHQQPSTHCGGASTRIGCASQGERDGDETIAITTTSLDRFFKRYISSSSSSSSTKSAEFTSIVRTRRNFVKRSIAATIATSLTTTSAIMTTSPLPAIAKDAPIITKQTVQEAFDAIRYELQSSDGVVSTLTKLINSGSYEDVMQYTKESDAYFRKAKLGKARKLLTDEKLRTGDSLYLSNAVTFDLIGINRASRPGKQNKEEQLRYLTELKDDIEKFLKLEDTIQIIAVVE